MNAAVAFALSPALLLAAAPALARRAPSSSASPGATPPSPCQLFTLPKRARHTRYALVAPGDATVLRASADASHANLVHPLTNEPAERLRWRWRVEQPVEGANLAHKPADNVTARVCALFDVALDWPRFGDRLRIILAPVLFSVEVPAAATCYVWDRHLPAGTWLANASTVRVQMLVLRNGQYGKWSAESRNLTSDFAHAFRYEASSGLPPLAAIGVAADGDNSDGRPLAYFDDRVLEQR